MKGMVKLIILSFLFLSCLEASSFNGNSKGVSSRFFKNGTREVLYRMWLNFKSDNVCVTNMLKHNDVKLITIDIDGTAAKSDGTFDNTVLDAIEEARNAGIYVVMATGRMYASVIDMFTEEQKNKYNMKAYEDFGIYAHGTYLRWEGKTEIIRPMSSSDLEILRETGIKYDLLSRMAFITPHDVFVYTDDNTLLSTTVKEKKHANEPESLENLAGYRIPVNTTLYKPVVVSSVDFLFSIKDVVSVEIYDSLFLNQPINKKVFTVVEDDLKRNFKTFTILNEHKVVLTTGNSGKSPAVAYFGYLLGININEVLSAGNDINDVDMLRATKYSVAVKNAITEAKDAARCVSQKTNNEHAIADIILKTIKYKKGMKKKAHKKKKIKSN